MKKNKLIFIASLILAIAAAYFIFKTTTGTLSKKNSDFAVIDTATITKVFLADKADNKVLLKKSEAGKWTVNEKYAASNDMINVLLKTVMRLEVKEPVAKAARNNVVKRISSIGTKVEIYQDVYRIDFWGIKLFKHEKLVKTYYVGDATQNMKGTYMIIDKSEEPYIMHIPGFNGFLSARYSALEIDWRDHSIFKLPLNDIKSVKLEFPSEPEKSFKIDASGKGSWTLTSLKANQVIIDFDTVKVIDYMLGFEEINYESIIMDNKLHNKDSITATIPFHIITVTDINNKSETVKTFHKAPIEGEVDIDDTPSMYDKDRLFAQFNNGKDFALIQFYVFDKILRPISYFLKTSANNDKKEK